MALAAALRCHPLLLPAGEQLLYHAAAHHAAHYAAGFALCNLAENVNLWRKLGFDDPWIAVGSLLRPQERWAALP